MAEYIEREAVVRAFCEHCRDYVDKCTYDGTCEVDIIATVPTADVQPVKWISIKDRLPEKDGNYLCYLECGAVCEAAFDSTIASKGEEFPFGEWVGVYNSDTRDFTDRYWEEYDAITHWMPLPEPPKDSDAE